MCISLSGIVIMLYVGLGLVVGLIVGLVVQLWYGYIGVVFDLARHEIHVDLDWHV